MVLLVSVRLRTFLTLLYYNYLLVPPRITVVPARQSRVDAGKNLTLLCNASGDPQPSIIWTKNGVPETQFNVSSNRLHFVNVQRSNVGSYKCTANNGYGTATSIAVVDVKCK